MTPQQPVYRKDYEVRRGSVWMFRITRGPKQEPVVQGFAHSYHLPGDSSITFNAKTDPEGYAIVTLPDEAVKVTISLSSKDMDDGRLVKLDKGHGFRTGALKGVSGSTDPESLVSGSPTRPEGRRPSRAWSRRASSRKAHPGHLAAGGRSQGIRNDHRHGHRPGRPTDHRSHRHDLFPVSSGGAYRGGMNMRSGPTPRAASSSARSRGRLARRILASSRSWCTRTVTRAVTRTSSSSSRAPTGRRSWALFA